MKVKRVFLIPFAGRGYRKKTTPPAIDFPEMMTSQTPFSMPGGSGWWGTQLRGCPPPLGLLLYARCAERPQSLIVKTGLVRNLSKPPMLAAEGDAVGGFSEIKEEAKGLGTFAQPANAASLAHTRPDFSS
jgi:hypothetical protein